MIPVLNPPAMTTGGIFGHQQAARNREPPSQVSLLPTQWDSHYPATLPFSRGSLWLGMVHCQSLVLEHTKAASYWCFLSFWRVHGNIQRTFCFQQAVVQGGCLPEDWKSTSATFESSKHHWLYVPSGAQPSCTVFLPGHLLFQHQWLVW